MVAAVCPTYLKCQGSYSIPVISSFPIHDEAGNPHKYLADEAGLFDFRPKRNHSLGEIADKVAELALEKISKTPDEPKHLDFDLPKKQESFDNIECLSINDVMQIWITTDNRFALGKFRKLVEEKTNPLGLK